MIARGKRRKTLSKIKPVKNINKNPQNFLEIGLVQEDKPSLGIHTNSFTVHF